MKQIFENWNRFCRKEKSADNRKLLKEQYIKVLNEVSYEQSKAIRQFIAQAGPYDYSFDDLFDGKMRLAFPLDTDDARNLKTAITAIRKEGYTIPGAKVVRSDGSEYLDPEIVFNRRRVKQKRRRLGTGEEYEIEITVADIEFEKVFDFTIPAGPRKGETIQKTDKRGIAKLMQKLIKERKLDPDLLNWWQRRQTYYTKDSNYVEIENLMRGDLTNYMVVLTRHPIDVLRMSDIGAIESCHSPKNSYFKCAVAEAKGHGPIAYLVKEKDYKDLLAGLYSEYDTADDPEAAFDMSEKFAKEKAEEFIRKHATRNPKFYSSLVKQLNNRELFEFGVDALKDRLNPTTRRDLEDLPSAAKDQLTYQAFHDAVSAARKGQEWSLLTGDEHEPEDLRDIGDFDTKEIFRDYDRDVKGIIAQSRVRLRKYYDQATDNTFAIPEVATYGPHPPGFVDAVRKWSWGQQKSMFIDEGPPEDERQVNFPREQDIIRYGGSWEDTKDGELFDEFFKEAGEEMLERSGYDGYNYYNFEHDTSDEGPNLYDVYNERIEELNDYANNTLEHFEAAGHVDDYNEEQPSISGGASIMMDFETNWKEWKLVNFAGGGKPYPGEYAEDGDYSIPEFEYFASNSTHREQVRVLSNLIEAGFENRLYSSIEGLRWRVRTDFPDTNERGSPIGQGRAVLEVEFNVLYEPETYEVDEFEQFIDELKECEGYYEVIHEKIRRALVNDFYLAPSPWDDTREEVEEIEDELQNFIVVGEDEDEPDGEVLFTLMGRDMGDSPSAVMSTGIEFPINKIPRKIDATDFIKNVFMSDVIGGGFLVPGFSTFTPSGKFSDAGESVTQRRQAIDIHMSQFKTEFLKHVKQLEEEANGYAVNQLELAFGDNYKRPAFKGVNFAEDTRIRVRVVGPTNWTQEAGSLYTMNPIIHYSFRIYATQAQSREALDGTFKFVRFVDKHVDMIHKAMQMTATKMIDAAIARIQVEHEKQYDGENAINLITKIQTDPNMREDSGAMAVITFIRKNWPNMSKMERLAAVEEYLEPMDKGSSKTIYDGEGHYTRVDTGDQGIFEQTPGYPYNWVWEVTKARRYYGAPHAVAKGSPFRYEPKLTPLDRDEMDLPRKEEELDQQAKEVSSMLEQCAPVKKRRGIRIKIK